MVGSRRSASGVVGKLLIIVVALAACGSDCSVDCPGQGVRFSLPQVPASTTTVRLCISQACGPPHDIEHLEIFEPNRTDVSFKIGDRVPVRVDALDDRGNVVATVSGIATTVGPKTRCRGWQGCIGATVLVDPTFSMLRDTGG